MAKSSIEWTESTWNPVTGCTKTSAGCLNCYAERMAVRLQAMGQPAYATGFSLALHPEKLTQPLDWRRPSTIFVNSMSDLFHEEIPTEFILQVFQTMQQASWHRFQILTKRAERLQDLSQLIEWPENVWMGVTVENTQAIERVMDLAKCHARVKFISCEPLLGPLDDLDLDGMNWVIVGGESGPHARPMKEEWAVSIRDKCLVAGVPYFFKQWGGWNNKARGRTLKGHIWDQMPRTIVNKNIRNSSDPSPRIEA